MFTLLYNDSGKPHRHGLAQGTTTVGRAPGYDLILHHGSVSRRHAVIEVDRGSCRITDVGSRLHTYRNVRAGGGTRGHGRGNAGAHRNQPPRLDARQHRACRLCKASMAREAVLCCRQDGLTIGELAADINRRLDRAPPTANLFGYFPSSTIAW